MNEKRTPGDILLSLVFPVGLTREDFDILLGLGPVARAATVSDIFDYPEDAYIMLKRESERAE